MEIQLGILGEGDLDPYGWLKVVHVDVERGQRVVVLAAEAVVRFAETVLVHVRRAVRAQQKRYLHRVRFLDGHVHFGEHGTGDREFRVDVGLRR